MASSSQLLALPRELRDAINQHLILAEQPVRLRRACPSVFSRRFTSRPAIILTSKQLHDEYFDAFDRVLKARDPGVRIQIHVSDFDFRQLQNFVTETGFSKLHVTLEVHPKNCPAECIDRFIWWQTCQDPRVDATYEIQAAAGVDDDSYELHAMEVRRLRWNVTTWGQRIGPPEMKKLRLALEARVHALAAQRWQGVIGRDDQVEETMATFSRAEKRAGCRRHRMNTVMRRKFDAMASGWRRLQQMFASKASESGE
ncbi:hypothetical protein LTR85_003621 [Meristemomyces frigidus]|nr:hypothetical protein LTR85_003621 [Meristemomyces frigidus]